ncbi:MAG: mandelate racemase/muconate lactonizing enzyme family protein [Cyclobacteriaceae bacterium]
MKIKHISFEKVDLSLTRPYKIAFKTVNSVENLVLILQLEDGTIGLGAGNPSKQVVGESLEEAMNVLAEDSSSFLIGRDIRTIGQLCYEVQNAFFKNPSVRTALETALYDAFTQYLDVPLVSYLGQKIKSLPTSITIGIKNVADTILEAQEYVDRGFKILKVKLGNDLAEDIERIALIRERFGKEILVRIDANQGYSTDDLNTFCRETRQYNLELIEQPMTAKDLESMRLLDDDIKNLLAADESLISPEDALKLLYPKPCCKIFNIKLMKCGGISEALKIAFIAQQHQVDLMWGCNDESIISIAAALHTAFSCSGTKYIDLDGSLDLAKDVVEGGFILEDGKMSVNGKPGLGVSLVM